MINGGIIAAGHGKRFKESGETRAKPLVQVAGRELLARTVEEFISAGIYDIRVIFRSSICRQCTEFLKDSFPGVNFHIICKDTSSSAHSFLELLSSCKDGERLIITTVDSIFRPGAIRHFRHRIEAGDRDGMFLGLTSFIDDEKPLYAKVDPATGKITGLGVSSSPWITCGVYYIPCHLGRGLDPGRFSALRILLGHLMNGTTPVYGVDLGKVIDVDRPSDIRAAEEFLASHKGGSLARN